MTDDQAMSLPGQPMGLSGLGQKAAQIGQLPAKLRRAQAASQERSQLEANESRASESKASEPKVRESRASGRTSEPKVSSVNQRPKVALKQLSLRIDDGTHSKISQAAQQADKSINAWMEEVLSEAADDTLGLGGDSTIHSDAIRYLIEDPDYSKRLIEAIAPHLQDNSFAAIFQFSHPLRKLLVGWDRIKPLLAAGRNLAAEARSPLHQSGVVKLTDAILPCLPSADPAFALQFNTALKKFLLGIAAVKPFMQEDKNHSLLTVIEIIGALVDEIEAAR